MTDLGIQPSASASPYRIAVGDFDEDGDSDVMFGFDRCSFLYVASLATGAGGFAALVEIPCGGLGSNMIQVLRTGDLTGDGHLDLVFSFYGELALGCGDGAGNFTFTSRVINSVFQREVFSTTAPMDLPTSIDIADLNADGQQDVVIAGQTYGERVTLFRRPETTACNLSPGYYYAGLDDYNVYDSAATVFDANGDGVADLWWANAETRTIRAWFGQQPATRVPWSVRLGGEHSHFGSDVTLVGTDLFDEPYERQSILLRPESVLPSGKPADFTRDLYAAHEVTWPDGTASSHPQGLRLLTLPLQTDGDLRFRRVPDHSAACPEQPYRIEVVPVFGAAAAREDDPVARSGLDLGVDQAGIVVRLDVRSDVGTLPPLSSYRVLQRVVDWRRADAWPSGPDFGEPDSSRFLPREVESTGCRMVYEPTYAFRELPRDDDDDFQSGASTGPRFAIEGGGTSIRVLTDRLGTFAVFGD